MHKLFLTKQVDDPSVGHLYEHIVCDDIAQFFRNRGLFSYVDYYLSAKTFHYGIVELAIELYTNEAASCVNELKNIMPLLKSENINGGLLQIMAEFYSDVKFIDDDLVLNRLSEYAKKAWQKTNHSSTEHKKMHLADQAIGYKKLPLHDFGIITQAITAHKDRIPSELLPLFLIVSKALRSNLQEDIVASLFCFTFEDILISDEKTLSDVNYYRIDKRQGVDLEAARHVAVKFMQNIRAQGFAKRLSASLRQSSPKAEDHPDPEEIYAKLNVRAAADIWQKTASESNISKLLDEIAITFSYKK